MLNEHLEHQVHQKLLANDAVSSQQISVTAKAGIVTLQGKVQSHRRKLAAHEIAAADKNVVEVRNELTVVSPDIDHDAAIAGRINELLDAARELTNESIRVEVRNRTVSLTGYVRTELERAQAADIATVIDGVKAVNNYLITNPEQVLVNRQHCEQVLQAISDVIGLNADNIRLAVVNETARLSGWVNSLWKKEAAEKVVRQFGVLIVLNEITVKP